MSLTTSKNEDVSGQGTTAINVELQKRYEEAMNRRKDRRAQKARSDKSSDVKREEFFRRDSSEKDLELESIEAESDADTTLRGEIRSDERESDVTEVNNEDIGFSSSDPDVKEPTTKKARYQVYETYFEEVYEDDYYQDECTQSTARNKPSCQWETYRSTSILFPPLKSNTCPKAIIHFVGGTFFGSYPRKFYGKLLEDIAIKCDAVVVATPIPLVLPGKGLVNRLSNWLFDDSLGDDDFDRVNKRMRRDEQKNNPLDHLHLAEAVQKEFNYAYRDVVIDEYCADFQSEEQVEGFMKTVPIIGVGHSLGARIQAISCSHPDVLKYLQMGKGRRLVRSGREGMIYLGFANWGASTSIPGVETLERTVRERDRSLRQEERAKRAVSQRDDVYGDTRASRRRRGQRGDDDLRRRYGRNYDRYSQYDVDDLDLGDVFSDVISGVTKGAKQIGAVLTPDADDLEFKPSPDELWDDLAAPSGGYSRSCRNTLIVQFDEDPIDQGSRLARVLINVNQTNLPDSADEEAEPNSALHDVKFARLKGGHLTPVSFRDGIGKILPQRAMSVITSSSDFLLQQLGDESSKSSSRQQKEMTDVVDTLSSYINDAIK
jgi:hypothetical protein